MDPIDNPYRPGAGTAPLILAGRDIELEKARILFGRVSQGASQRSLMLYGLRGVGKTVLLNEIQNIGKALGYLVEHIEISEDDDFRTVMARTLRKILFQVNSLEKAKRGLLKAFGVLKAFTLKIPDGPEFKFDVEALTGSADSGNLQSDLVDLVLEVGAAAAEEGKRICITIDETQYLEEKSFSALIAASHQISQKGFPLIFICAGLPQIAALSGNAKSYAERLFDFIPVGNLKEGDARKALLEPARAKGVKILDDVTDEIVKITEGYPYFIQEFGKSIWDISEESPITMSDYLKAKESALDSLDNSFFKVRIDRAAEGEKKVMRALANLGKGPHKMSEIASALKVKVQSLGPVRSTLIHKGFVYSPNHGFLEFTVPQFDEFMKRYYSS